MDKLDVPYQDGIRREYYIPFIEDLHVGYECELFWNQDILPENNWYPIIVGELGTEDIEYKHRIEKKEIRTPYLTKEQIEGEGWKITHREQKNPPYQIDWINAKKGEFSLWINLAMHKSMTLGIDGQHGIVFRGKCLSINEFRTISKLLGI